MIRHSSAIEAFAAAASAMASDSNVVDIIASLLHDCASLLPASSAAIMVTDDNTEHLVLLHATSHRASEMEMLQVQSSRGPCVECVAGNALISEAGAAAIAERWGDVGEAIVDAGYASVASFPMCWHERVLGGLNLFRSAAEPLSAAQTLVAQGFADMATLALVRPSEVPVERLTARVAEAVQSRSAIEQAKGVLAHLHGVDVGTAYDLLVGRLTDEDQSIISAAQEIIRSQHD